MNKNTVTGQWKQISGRIRERWGKLTDDDLKAAEGNKVHLLGKLQEHYGLAREKAEKLLKEIGYV